MEDLEQLLAGLSPDELEQLLGMGTLDERGALLQQQQAQAEALRQKPGMAMGHVSPWGAALAGLGDVANQVRGGVQGQAAGQGLESLLGKKDAGRGAFVEALRRRKGVPAGAGMGDMGAGAFGLG